MRKSSRHSQPHPTSSVLSSRTLSRSITAAATAPAAVPPTPPPPSTQPVDSHPAAETARTRAAAPTQTRPRRARHRDKALPEPPARSSRALVAPAASDASRDHASPSDTPISSSRQLRLVSEPVLAASGPAGGAYALHAPHPYALKLPPAYPSSMRASCRRAIATMYSIASLSSYRPRRSSGAAASATAPAFASSSRGEQALDSAAVLSQPSAKALGKRRASSPPPPNDQRASGPSAPAKRRRKSKKDVNYNLRPRASADTTSIKKAEQKIMARKGSKASRAAKAKASQYDDDGDDGDDYMIDDHVMFDHDDDDILMASAGEPSTSSNRRKSRFSVVQDKNAPNASDAETKSDQPALSTSLVSRSPFKFEQLAAAKPSNDMDDVDDADDDDEEEESGSNEDVSHGEEGDDGYDDFETALNADGSVHDGYGSEGEHSDMLDPPQTYDEDGSPIGSHDDHEGEGMLSQSEAAALFGSGAGGAFRALQGLMSGMSTRLKTMLNKLKDKDASPASKLGTLQELSELLSVSTEDTLAGYFQTESFVKEFVNVLRGDSNGVVGGASIHSSGMTEEEMIAFGMDPTELMAAGKGISEEDNIQMMLLACRCLANLMEALPGSAHSVVYAGAVPVLCSKLLDIQYIDLAEQTLSTLEKISEEAPSSIVREGGLSALLSYLDFFSFHVQRTAVTAAANCCRSLTPDSFSMVQDVMPIFRNVLGYPDQRVVEQSCLAIVRIVDSYRHYPEKLDALMTSEVLSGVKVLLNPDSTTVGPGTYSQMIKMLSTASRASPQIAISLVQLNIASTVYHLLTGVAPPAFETDEGLQVLSKDETLEDDMLVVQNLVQRPKEQVQETLNLICEMLPSLPKDGVFDTKAFIEKRSKREEKSSIAAPTGNSTSGANVESEDVKMSIVDGPLDSPALSTTRPKSGSRTSSRTASKSGKSRGGENGTSKDDLIEKRIQCFTEAEKGRKLVVNRFYALLLPVSVNVCLASVNTQVRTRAVTGLLKMVNYCDVDELTAILGNVAMASFLASLLSSEQNSTLLISALQLAELLLVRVPDAYQYFFRREGVLHQIEQLASAELVSQSSKSKKTVPDRSDQTTESGIGRSLRMHAASTGAEVTSKTLTPFEAQTRDSITLRARHLRDQYGSADSEPALRARRALDSVRQLVKNLEQAVVPEDDADVEEKVCKVLGKIVELFANESETLSSFELLESGLVQGLLKFVADADVSALSSQRRQELLSEAFFSQTASGSAGTASALLVKRLQDSLSRREQFEVQMATAGISDVDSGRSGPAMLARQLKLRLVAEEGSDIPKSCSNIVVSIHAIATFQAFNDYLRPRIIAASSGSDRASGLAAILGISGSGSSAPDSVSGLLAALSAAADRSSRARSSGDRATSNSTEGASATLSTSASMSHLGSNENAEASTSRLSSSLGGAAAASSSSKPIAAGPSADTSQAGDLHKIVQRRRSRRLSGKGVEQDDEEPQAQSDHKDDGNEQGENEYCEYDDEDSRDRDALFADDFEQRDERPVNLEVADDKVVAKTPDGTRVGTPTLSQTSETTSRPSAPKPRASYAAALKAEPTDFHLEFTMGDQRVDLDTTVYGAVHMHESRTPEAQRRNIWHSIFEVKFRKVAGPARPDGDHTSPSPFSRKTAPILEKMPASVPEDSQQANILQLLWVLHKLNADFVEQQQQQRQQSNVSQPTGLAEVAFVNNKLTAKLNRQLEEPMIVASACLPDWSMDLPVYFPFLFPFETRYTFLQSTAFGYARLMQKWVGQTRSDASSTGRRDENLGFLGRLPRQKVRISRERVLESAFKVFELYGSSRASLEVEFFSEVGSGLGPTLEFYALVSKEFAKKELKLWRDSSHSDESSAFVHSPNGLFPAPTDRADSEEDKKRLKTFRVLGQFVAKALMDSRIIDVHFSRAFMRLVLDDKLPATIATVRAIDKDLGSSLTHLQSLSDERRAATSKDDLFKVTNSISDLTLDFTLPGYDIELKPGGKDISVDADNIDEYISLVLEWTVSRGVEKPLQEFKSGFSNVFSVRDMQSFTPAELVMLTSALDEDWTVECLTNSTKADHGFTMDSRPVKDLLSIMSEFSMSERREFLSFTTGSPRLPIGGFAALTPPLTIVRKDGGDGSLFSTMTCANFLKLPNYSSREVVKERVLFAIREGQGGFHLS
ncbi:Ubiquitin fusion degradation protein 4 [Microbotryomycetes sp. JL201]|nr:Ubiquitin fusion degradation protein 4 [Microbotryomycetes sp. JL201]